MSPYEHRAEGTGHVFPAVERNLPDKVPGKHRWVAVAMFHVSSDGLRESTRGNHVLLDQENLLSVASGCYDCEESWPAPEPCRAGDRWVPYRKRR